MNSPSAEPPLPDFVRDCTTEKVTEQRVRWEPDPWRQVFVGHAELFEALTSHAAEATGIARDFVHTRAGGDPIELFLAAMAWGWGSVGYGPTRVKAVLSQPGAMNRLAAIVDTVRNRGAGEGWTALLAEHKVPGLGMAFGTKLLYFAGYRVCPSLRPLILDARVRAALQAAAPGTVPGTGRTVWRDDYLRYLKLANAWAAEPTWAQDPDVVEYALFNRGGGARPDADDGDGDEDARPGSEE
jgi:hypothetical protein